MEKGHQAKGSHHINSLEVQPRRFVKEEIDNCGTEQVTTWEIGHEVVWAMLLERLTSKNKSVREANCRYDKWCEESKEEIPEPVAGCRDGPLLCSGASGECFSDEDPDATVAISRASASLSLRLNSRSPRSCKS